MLFVVLKQNTNLFNFIGETERQGVEEQADGEDDKQETQITEDDLEVGRNGYISSAQIIERATGTGPWDDDDEPGNDSSPDNDIVRSFDQVTWTVNLITELKEGAQQASYTGGVVEFTASLPEEYAKTEFAPYMEWDLDSMGWIEDASLSEDGITLTGKYSLSETERTVPGAQTLVFVLKLYGVANDSEFAPTFTFNLAGNEEDEKTTITDTNITVSAAGKYNMQLCSNETYLSDKTTVDYGQGETSGRMYGYGFTVQLYNEEESKGLKGIEYPQGEINFDIDLKLERSKAGSEEVEDITDEATPILWNYKINDRGENLVGEIEDRGIFFDSTYDSTYIGSLPSGVDNGDRSWSTYNSGNIAINQEDNKLHITINNYGFDDDYPRFYISYTDNSNRTKIYGDNVGTFSVGYIQIFVPDTTASTEADYNYYFRLEDNNFSTFTNSDEKIEEQMITSDDSIQTQHLIFRQGIFNGFIDFDNIYDNRGRNGNVAIIKNQVLWVNLTTELSNRPDLQYYIYSENFLFKFDGAGLEPAGDDIVFGEDQNSLEFNAYYLTKKDGANWVSQEEMNNTVDLDDFNIYKEKNDIPEGDTIIGLLFESVEGGMTTPTWRSITVRMKAKEDAEINKTYGMTFGIRAWTEENQLDRTIYSVENKDINFSEYPTPTYIKEGQAYIKTEYNENGQIISGTHSGGYYYGNTILVTGANLHGNIRTVDGTNTEKTNYDLGRNENIVTYSVEPALDANTNLESQIENVTLKADVTLPSGLTYVPGSSKRGDTSFAEPVITENEDGSKTLTWYLYGVTSGDTIEPILFDAQIDNNTANNTQFETKFVVSEVIGEDGISKIGNSEISFRTSTTSINIINMSSYRLYKETSTPIVESNGEITYKVVYQNNADSTVPEFQILDILPYNGDGRGTSYNGTYTLKNVNVTSTGDETSVDNLTLYTTTSPDARRITPKDESIGVSEIWQEKEIGAEINEAVTVIALKGEVGRNTNLEIEITLQTTNNRGGDVYYNQATAQIRKDIEVITTSSTKVETVKREVSGTIWYDTNENGVIDTDESRANRIEVELLKADGSKAVDYNGN